MSVETEAAAMAVKIGLEITGTVAKETVKLGSTAAREVAAILLVMLKSARTKAAGAMAAELLSRDGVTPVLATMTKAQLSDFKKSARKLGIPFIVAKNRDGEWNVVTRGSDAAVTNEILDQIGYGQLETERVAASEALPDDPAHDAKAPPLAVTAPLTPEDWRQLFEQVELDEGGDPRREDFQELLNEVFPAGEYGAEMGAPESREPESPEISDPNAEPRAAGIYLSARGSLNENTAWSSNAENLTRTTDGTTNDAPERKLMTVDVMDGEEIISTYQYETPARSAEPGKEGARADGGAADAFPTDAGAKRQLAWGAKKLADETAERVVETAIEKAGRAVRDVGKEL
ncbi:MAG: DUF3801 domain-containing protein [Oscillospiraceae bacterium]|jgi:hypothetical protein|nr:DUF3801 domain-containing protein [Oscillospiraceae bacterium]